VALTACGDDSCCASELLYLICLLPQATWLRSFQTQLRSASQSPTNAGHEDLDHPTVANIYYITSMTKHKCVGVRKGAERALEKAIVFS
jgi:hypothetical protein